MNVVGKCIAAAEIMGLVMLLVLLYAMVFENRQRDVRTRSFTLCVVFSSLTLALDIPSWLLENVPGYDALVFHTVMFSFITSLLIVYFLTDYSYEVLGRRCALPKALFRPVKILCLLGCTGVVVVCRLGLSFTVEEGVFTYGPVYSLSAWFVSLGLLYLLTVALLHVRSLGVHDVAAFGAYVGIPAIALLVEMLHPELGLTVAATAPAVLVLYVMLQAGQNSELRTRGERLQELTCTDILTGLLNRRAFDSAFDSLLYADMVCVGFLDVNGLKVTNDTAGHAAGDALLVRFAKMLSARFSADSLFRISGDEFVILIGGLKADSFESRIADLKKDIAKEKDIASVGIACGRGCDLSTLLKTAEENMYLDKAECYKRHPEYVRK